MRPSQWTRTKSGGPEEADREGKGVETKTLEPVHRTHLLLVEDDHAMRGMLAFVLGKHGYFVTGARDGRQALEYLDDMVRKGGHRQMPQLLLADQRMPGFQGLDLIEATRAAGMEISAILITAFPDADVRDRAHTLGIPVLEKPFEMTDLIAFLRLAAPQQD
jgi:DNA-binding response OmpR family regulator